MKPRQFEYVRPRDLATALECLAKGGARPLAGGQTLIPQLSFRQIKVECLVDISRLDELKEIVRDGDRYLLGAGVTAEHAIDFFTRIGDLAGLTEALSFVGCREIRHRATLGGMIGAALPESQFLAFGLAAGAEVLIQTSEHRRSCALEDLLLGVESLALRPRELITGISLPVDQPATRTGLEELRKQRPGQAMVGVALYGIRQPGKWSAVRVVRFQRGSVARRWRSVEDDLLAGRLQVPEDPSSAGAARDGRQSFDPFSEHVATHLLERLLIRLGGGTAC